MIIIHYTNAKNNFNHQNPPWQFLMTKTKDDENLPSVTSSKWSGLIFDVVEELSNKLNFTFKTIVVDVSPEIIARKSVNKNIK